MCSIIYICYYIIINRNRFRLPTTVVHEGRYWSLFSLLCHRSPFTGRVGSLKNCGEGVAVVSSSKLIPSETAWHAEGLPVTGRGDEVGCSYIYVCEMLAQKFRIKKCRAQPPTSAMLVCVVFPFRDHGRACVKIRDTSVNEAKCGGRTVGVTKG